MIRPANKNDYGFLTEMDKHIDANELIYAIERGRILIYETSEKNIAWLRYNLFWDNTPFCNMLYVLEPHRNNGIAKSLVTNWENEMKKQGRSIVMTSTQANENGQYFWRSAGYVDCGSFKTENDCEELILYKKI